MRDFIATDASEYGIVSHNGKWMAFTRDTGGSSNVYISMAGGRPAGPGHASRRVSSQVVTRTIPCSTSRTNTAS